MGGTEHDSGPRHATIAADLRSRIRSGELQPGSAIRSEAELAANYRVSHGTVRQALASLRSEGLIAGGQGRRPTVARPTLAQSFDKLLSFSSWAESLGLKPSAHDPLEMRRPADAVTLDLELDEGAQIFQYRRLRLLDGEAGDARVSSFIEPVGRLLIDCDLRGSVYTQLGEMGVVFSEHTSGSRDRGGYGAGRTARRPSRGAVARCARVVLDPDGRPLETSTPTAPMSSRSTIHNRAAQTSAGVGLSLAGS